MFIGSVNCINSTISSRYKNNIIKNINALPKCETKKCFYSYPLSFCGVPLHIVDGGNHLTNMDHFIRAISKEFDTELHVVETNPNDNNIKQLKSLENELKKLNERTDLKGEYIAVPALACVALLNIEAQYNRVMNDNQLLTPENIKVKKPQLLSFLKKIYENPQKYKEIIGYMDSNSQGIEYTYGVIREINSLISKGANVYIPSGHPQDLTLKYFAKKRGINEELYHLIATGEDIGGKIKNLHEEIKSKNWYEFNLLSLSDANVVGVKNTKGAQDYMFAAYDSCITDGARGVYNFSPVRQNGELIGYSYTDTTTNEYPFDEFPANDEVENIVIFVGKQLKDVLATQKETEDLNKAISTKAEVENCANKLYHVSEVFSDKEIHDLKLKLRGDYTDRTRTLFFRENKNGEVIFPKCDCEGSGKPGVLSMWGSCFAVFNAIARDFNLNKIDKSEDIAPMLKLINEGKEYLRQGLDKEAEKSFYFANQKFKVNKNQDGTPYKENYIPYYYLGQIHINRSAYDKAENCYNNGLNILSTYLKKNNDIRQLFNGEFSIKKAKEFYEEYLKEHNEKTERLAEPYKLVIMLSRMYEKLGFICEQTGQEYHANICRMAAKDILYGNERGEEILSRRVQKIRYIGDLYSENNASV